MDKLQKLGYRPDIEGLRAIAILLVVAAHAKVPWLQGGFVGVDVFFVLSGYLITALLVGEIVSTGRLDFGAFYARRFRRLVPGLVLMLVVISALAWALLSPWQQTELAGSAASAALWVSNFHFAFAQLDYFGADAGKNLFLHTWSLGVEEQFYVVWPLLLALSLKAFGREGAGAVSSQRLRWVLGLVCLVSLVLSLWLTYTYPRLAFYMMPARCWQFALGALVWMVFGREKLGPVQDWQTLSERTWVWLGWLGLGIVMFAGLAFGPDSAYPGWRALIPTIGTGLVLAAGGQTAHGVAGFLSTRPLQALGRVSYAWYLWHWPILLLGISLYGDRSLLLRVVLAVTSLGLAALAYRFVESPLRHQPRLVQRPLIAVPATLVALVALGLAFIQWSGAAIEEQGSHAQERVATAKGDTSVLYIMGCDSWFHDAKVHACQFGDAQAPHLAVLMGDSVGAQWFPALKEHFMAHGWQLRVLTKSACPMVDVSIFYDRIGRVYNECTEWRRGALAYIKAHRPDLVVLGSTTGYALTPAEWEKGTSSLLKAISGSSGSIVMLRPTPLLPFDGPDCLASNGKLSQWLTLGHRCESPSTTDRNQAVTGAMEAAASGFDNVRLLDMNDFVCPQNLCRAQMDGRIVFRDSQHLSASFARSMSAAFLGRLENLRASPGHVTNNSAGMSGVQANP